MIGVFFLTDTDVRRKLGKTGRKIRKIRQGAWFCCARWLKSGAVGLDSGAVGLDSGAPISFWETLDLLPHFLPTASHVREKTTTILISIKISLI